MPKFESSEIIDGMVVGRDVVDYAGNVIIPSGSVVSQRIRVALNTANIYFVEITEESAGLAELIYDVDAGKRQNERKAEKAGEKKIRVEEGKRKAAADTAQIQGRLVLLAQMFSEHRSDNLMRELCRLAIKCAKEGLVGA